jgi:Protein of unknown function (DUF3011)
MKGVLTRAFAVALLCLCALPVAAQQIQAKAYAPERVWELPVTDQRRVIALEYSDQSGGRTIPEEQMRFYLDQVRLSNWTFQQIKNDIAQSLGSAGNGYPPANSNSGETIRCESTDGRQRTCTTPWQTESRLIRQLSSSPCTAGQNWSSSRGQVWVSGGCRAEFSALVSNAGGEISCESSDGRPRTCATPWPGSSDLLRQISGTPCVAGQNWSSSRGEVRVTGGCRGLFVPTAESLSQEIRCESSDGRYKQCGSNLYGNPQLIRQLSGTRCLQGSNWGMSNGSLWVNGGCRAVFSFGGSGGGYNNGSGYDNGYGYSVTCESAGGSYITCAWDRNRGVPQLLQTLSDSPCTQGTTWGYTQRVGLWVNRGCRGRFGIR